MQLFESKFFRFGIFRRFPLFLAFDDVIDFFGRFFRGLFAFNLGFLLLLLRVFGAESRFFHKVIGERPTQKVYQGEAK